MIKELRSLRADEHRAIRNYGRQSEQLSDSGVTKTLKHIRGEEKEHAKELSGHIKKFAYAGKGR